MDPNAISLAARTLRTRLASSLALDERNILISHPAFAAKDTEGKAGSQFVNLFFFQLEHGGYPSDATSVDPVYVRLHCLVTAFGNKDSASNNSASAGENDLRLIGGVLAALHQQPVLEITDQGGTAKAMLQIVPAPFSPETINNLWSTQFEASYRPSAVYELALVPVPFKSRTERSRRVAHADGDAGLLGASRGDWVPEIRFRDATGTLRTALEFTPANPPGNVEVAVGGVVGESVTLRWEIWHPKHGWRADPDLDQTVNIDAATPQDSSDHAINLPGPAEAGKNGQSMLVAVRAFERPPGTQIVLRSNPLLVSFFEAQT